jgi:hypothetical protein
MDQDNLPPSLFAGSHPSGLFTLSEGEVGASWPLAVPGQLQDELGGGHPGHPTS